MGRLLSRLDDRVEATLKDDASVIFDEDQVPARMDQATRGYGRVSLSHPAIFDFCHGGPG